MDFISLTAIIVRDILQTTYFGTLKNLIECVMSFLDQHSMMDKFPLLRAMMPSYPSFARFDKQYSQGTQWSGREMNAVGCVIVPVLAATL